MAEYGSHHATHGKTKPTIFEVIGQENLVIGLRSAFRHLFKVLAENFPEKFSLLYEYFDEGYMVVDSVFQYIHLRLKGGLFTETFYGLKRYPDPRSANVSRKKVFMWVFFSVVGPYIQSQLKILYQNVQEKYRDGSLNYNDFRKYIVLFFRKAYPICQFLWEMIVLSCYMRYGLGITDFPSPALYLTSTKLVPVTLLDMDSDAWKTYIPKIQHRTLSMKLWNLINSFVGGITLTISVGAFFVQFLEWWYNQDNSKRKFASLPSPPPPSKWPLDLPAGICPVCKQERKNDTALSSSGFVFCYPCVFRYVRDTYKCPVTGYKSSLGQLIKLYYEE